LAGAVIAAGVAWNERAPSTRPVIAERSAKPIAYTRPALTPFGFPWPEDANHHLGARIAQGR